MESTRMQKVSRLIQKDLGEIIQFEYKHVLSGAMVTVTKVTITKDMSIARVFLSMFATQDKEGLMLVIKQNTKQIRHALSQRTKHQLRTIPNLEFHLDDSLDYIENIDNLLSSDE